MTSLGAATLSDLLPAPGDPDAVYEAFATWAEDRGLSLYPAQTEALIELVSGSNVILSTPTGSGKSLVATGAHFAALTEGQAHLLHRPDQGAGEREVLRPDRGLRRRQGRHDDRRRHGQRRRPDHLLHRRDPRQPGAARRAGRRRRPGRDGRVPLLLRPAPRLGVAGAAARAAPRAVPADVGHPRRRHPLRRRPDPTYRPPDRGRRQRRTARTAALLLRLDAAARDDRGPAQHQAVARLHRALHPGVGGRARPVAHEHQHVHPRGEGPDRRPDRRFPVHRRLRQDA